MFLQYTHQNTYMWNLKPYLWGINFFQVWQKCFILLVEGSFSYFCNWIGPSLCLSGPRLRSAILVWGVSVKRFPLIHFIFSATSKPFVHTAQCPPLALSFQGLRVEVQDTDCLKKKPSGQRKRWGAVGVGWSHAGQSKWQAAVKSVLWAPTYMWSSLTCEISQLPLVFR